MKDSPFIYGTTVSVHSFTNREKERQKLQDNLLGNINTMIISPRRWGKSSLVEKVIHDINQKEKKTKTVIIDLFSVGSEEEFLEKFAREVLKASSSKWQEWLNNGKEFFKRLIPRFSLGLDPENDFSISFDWKELKSHAEEILDLPETIAQKRGLKWIICLDEFQHLSTFKGYEDFERKMRAVWQRQKLVTYCLYGSKRHMMADIFNNPSKPFYRFGDLMLLPRISKENWVKFICEGFAKSSKEIAEQEAETIATLMKNHSWYVQQFSHYTWNMTEKTATRQEIEAALNELINANTPFYQKEVESISATQLNLLKAVARGERQFTSTAVMSSYQLGTPNNVGKNKATLIQEDIIQELGGTMEFVDPAFELWFKKQFLGIPFIAST